MFLGERLIKLFSGSGKSDGKQDVPFSNFDFMPASDDKLVKKLKLGENVTIHKDGFLVKVSPCADNTCQANVCVAKPNGSAARHLWNGKNGSHTVLDKDILFLIKDSSISGSEGRVVFRG